MSRYYRGRCGPWVSTLLQRLCHADVTIILDYAGTFLGQFIVNEMH
jgi:hypothetical protein